MEVVGAVSGIAGLLSLGGQVFSGAIKLIEAIEDMKDRDDQARHLKEEVSDLASVSIRLSLNVQSLRADSDFIESDFKMLEENIQSHLVDCDVDLRRWGTILKKHYSTPLTRMQKLSEMFRKDDRRELRAINRLLGEWRSKLSLDINELNSLFSSSGWRKLDKAHETMLNSHYELTEIHKAMLATANMDSKTSFRKLSEHFLRFEDDRIERENAFYAKISTEVMEIKSYVSSIDTSLRSSLRKGSIWTRFVRSDTKSDSYDGSTFREQDQSASQNTFDTKSVSHYGGTFKEKDQSASRQPKGVKVLRADGISKSAIWSCGETLGIDDYFVETETRDKISCLLCMEEIDTDAGYEQARHLVESHQFNECDPGHYFTSKRHLKAHLQSQHAADPDALEHYRAKRDFGGFERRWSHCDSRIYDLSGRSHMPEDLQSTNTTALRSEMSFWLATIKSCLVLQDHQKSSLKDEATASAAMYRGMNSALTELSVLVFTEITPDHKYISALLQASRAEEELIIYYDDVFPQRWAPLPGRLIENRMSYDYWGKRIQPRSSKPLEASEVGSYFSRISKQLRGLEIPDVIDSWMFDCLQRSDYLLAFLRCTGFGNPPCSVDRPFTAGDGEKLKKGDLPLNTMALVGKWNVEWVSGLVASFDYGNEDLVSKSSKK